MNSNLLNRIIAGTQSILSATNKIIPLYEEIKPIYRKMIKYKNKLQNLNLSNLFNGFQTNIKTNNDSTKKEEQVTYSSIPQFFQ